MNNVFLFNTDLLKLTIISGELIYTLHLSILIG